LLHLCQIVVQLMTVLSLGFFPLTVKLGERDFVMLGASRFVSTKGTGLQAAQPAAVEGFN
jgi:hypothetical protein